MNKAENQSKSSNIKSKKDKRNQGKPRGKNSFDTPQIVISSGSSNEGKQSNRIRPSQLQMIEQNKKDKLKTGQNQGKIFEKREQATKIIRQELKPQIVVNLNKFNLKNLQKASVPLVDIVYPNEPLQKDNEPTIVESDQPQLQMQKTSALRNLYTYRRQGSQSIYYTSMLNVRQKINDSLRPKKMAQLIELDEKQEKQDLQTQRQKKDQKEGQQKSRGKTPRYFQEKKIPGDAGYDSDHDEKVIKCFRCKQQGHIARNCPQQALRQRCAFCLQEHHYSECDKNRCFKCGEKDHVAQKCLKKAIRCHKCNKLGHKEQSCGFLVFLDYHSKQESEINQKYDKQDMRRLKCLLGGQCNQGARGHFNCFIYTKNKPMPYQKRPRDQFQSSQKGYTNKYNDFNQKNKYDKYDRRQHDFAKRYQQKDFDSHRSRNYNQNKYNSKDKQRQRSYRK